jgi:hypothetical protein
MPCSLLHLLSHLPFLPLSSSDVLLKMTEVSEKRKAETGLWEHYKPLLQFLFIDQNRTLKEVRDIMAKGCGFDRKCVTSLGLNEKPRLVSHTPGHPNMNSGSRTGNFAKTSLGKSGGKQSLSWINESSMESYLLL